MNPSIIPRVLGLAVVLAFLASSAEGHAGHKALELKGIRVEGDKLTLCPEAAKSVGLVLGDVATATIDEELSVPATVEVAPEAHYYVAARVPGRLVTLRGAPGDAVREGDVMAEIESPELESRIRDIAVNDARVAVARSAVEHSHAAVERKVAAGAALDALEIDLAAAEAEARIARERAEAFFGGPLPDTGAGPVRIAVTAPRSGIVASRLGSVGDAVAAGTSLLDVHDLTRVLLIGQVFETDVGRIERDQRVTFRVPAYPNREFHGEISRTSYEIDRVSRRLDVLAPVENADLALKPGIVGRMSILVRRAEDVVTIPAAAVVRMGADAFTFVLDSEASKAATEEEARRQARAASAPPPSHVPGGENAADAHTADAGAPKPLCGGSWTVAEPLTVYQRKLLVLGRERNGAIEVQDGVFPGDRVVVRGIHELASLYVPGVFHLSDAARTSLGVSEVEVLPVARDEVVRVPSEVVVPPEQVFGAASPVAGRVVEVLVKPGERVERGAVLVRVESLAVLEASLDVSAAAARLASATARLGRARALVDAGAVPAKDLVVPEGETRLAEAELAGARRVLAARGADEQDVERAAVEHRSSGVVAVRAPAAGVVTQLDATIGRVVEPTEHVAEITDLSNLMLRGTADSRDVGSITPGADARARLVAFPAETIDVRLARSLQSFDPATRTLGFLAPLPNPQGRFVPGMTGDLFVVVGRKPEAIAIPRAAVLADGGGTYVVAREKDTYRLIPVVLGRGDDRYVDVVSGVVPGVRIVTTGKEGIRNGLATVR